MFKLKSLARNIFLMTSFALSFACFSSRAMAGAADGPVVNYYIHYFNNFFVFTVANKTNKPSCDATTRFVVDVATDKGKTIASAIMAAKSSAATVHVEGAGVCSVWGDSEDVTWIQVR